MRISTGCNGLTNIKSAMRRRLRTISRAGLIALTLVVGCTNQAEPISVEYASYEDCVLGKLGRGQSKIASQAIIDACAAKYPKAISATVAAKPVAPQPGAGLFDDLIPPSGAGENPYAKFAPAAREAPQGLWDELDAAAVKPEPVPRFHGYECTDDCSGHEAGYEWAEENGTSDASNCGGNSRSFIEGCKVWTESN